MTRLRCAVYTRKSTEEGLEQDFNSLDAQREACEAYISSQKSEGWTLIKARYDDGGYSGGSMKRPALDALMEDLKSNRIDVVVVYKVDRLTRSLMDFAKLVELFDQHQVSFVSVTQAFNTTSSMGRLTLNVLLSFAQFEREVTAERIRDKIAASKKKGMWMGGSVPLGYDLKERRIHINPQEAETVRTLFNLYLKLNSLQHVVEETERRGIRTKRITYSTGRTAGGGKFLRGPLQHILTNPIYLGKVRHGDEIYEGEHDAIIEPSVWEAVQQKLAKQNNGKRKKKETRKTLPSPLLSLLYDEDGQPFTSDHCNKNGRRYRYYISKPLNGKKQNSKGWRIPAEEIERKVESTITEFLRDPIKVQDALGAERWSADQISGIQKTIDANLFPTTLEDQRKLMQGIAISTTLLKIDINLNQLADVFSVDAPLDEEVTHEIQLPIQMKRRGVERRIVIGEIGAQVSEPNHALIRLIAKAHLWFDQLKDGEVKNINEIATNENIHPSDVSRFLPLAFLAPDIIEALVSDSNKIDISVDRIRALCPPPCDWRKQHRAFSNS